MVFPYKNYLQGYALLLMANLSANHFYYCKTISNLNYFFLSSAVFIV